MSDWKPEVGVTLIMIGLAGLFIHQRAAEHARQLDDQLSAMRWTPDDTVIAIEQRPKLMDQPLGDYPTPPRSQLDTLDFNRPTSEF